MAKMPKQKSDGKQREKKGSDKNTLYAKTLWKRTKVTDSPNGQKHDLKAIPFHVNTWEVAFIKVVDVNSCSYNLYLGMIKVYFGAKF